MCLFSSAPAMSMPPMPSMPAAPPPPPDPPQAADPAVKAAREDARRRAAGLQGYRSTIATSGLGLAGAPAPNTTGFKTLLGQ
ncbi:MAG: hypothetical protein Q8K93_31360 [Reyranella sp.]|uniref:hypothetical protein n=1 Tax=Reyranella sp. TaxID=1929291 RepID=UPI00272FAE96|nr:hypothetical protein [Reyranella sp.]MDP1966688.1 hypothetical protein [Reyranella sp.]MDP2372735.1 hypothetical protein [Reyranella sp.]